MMDNTEQSTEALLLNNTALNQNSGTSESISITKTFPDPDVTANKNPALECFKIDDEETWKDFWVKQRDPKTNITNKNTPKLSPHKDSIGGNVFTARDENKYNGKDLIGKIPEQIKKEISQYIKNTTPGLIRIKEAKAAGSGIVYPSIRMKLSSNETINMSDAISGDVCKKYGIRSITLMLSDKVRGISCKIDDHGTKTYEVANGSYEMVLRWYVDEKKCIIKVSINDSGNVELLGHNGVNLEDLKANNVKIGRQHEAKSLYEALSSQLQQAQLENFEIVQPSTSMTGIRPQGKQVASHGRDG